jgi:hypothetical protein
LRLGNCELKRRPIKRVSDKRKAQNTAYLTLKARLLWDCMCFGGGFTFKSELNGELTDHVELHHIDKRNGARLFDPFNIIVVTPEQHCYEQAHHSFSRIQELKAIVRPIRLAQDFKEQIDETRKVRH